MNEDEPTRFVRPQRKGMNPQPRHPEDDETTHVFSDNEKTIVPNKSHNTFEDDEKTIVYRPNRTQTQSPADSSNTTAESVAGAGFPDSPDPVAGWLVVIEGNGRGHFQPIGVGINTVGRGPDQRISFPYNDQQISRTDHIKVVYDIRTRKFYVQPGTGTQLGYLNENPILDTTELQAFQKIVIGATTLLFVPVCGEQFNWQ